MPAPAFIGDRKFSCCPPLGEEENTGPPSRVGAGVRGGRSCEATVGEALACSACCSACCSWCTSAVSRCPSTTLCSWRAASAASLARASSSCCSASCARLSAAACTPKHTDTDTHTDTHTHTHINMPTGGQGSSGAECGTNNATHLLNLQTSDTAQRVFQTKLQLRSAHLHLSHGVLMDYTRQWRRQASMDSVLSHIERLSVSALTDARIGEHDSRRGGVRSSACQQLWLAAGGQVRGRSTGQTASTGAAPCSQLAVRPTSLARHRLPAAVAL